MAQIETVVYGKTFNMGNFESIRVDVTVRVAPGETPEQALEQARAFVEAQYQALRPSRGQQRITPPVTTDASDIPF